MIVCNNGASVSFTPPLPNGSGPITSYTATATPTVGSTLHTFTGSGSPLTFPQILNGSAVYRFSVHANNAAGAGRESASTGAISNPC